MRTCLIVNPAAGAGGATKRLEEIRAAFAAADLACVYTTRSAGDEARVTRGALTRGCEVIVVVGGDGTCSRVANEILSNDAECQLAVVPMGTGNDFSKTLGVQLMTFAQIATIVGSQNPSGMDVGRVDGHHFLNSCGFGFDASVLEATERVRFLKGDAVYIYSALRQLFSYRGLNVSVRPSSNEDADKILMLTVSNGRYLGGAFRIAPNASAVDGQLDFGFFGDTDLIGRVRIFAGAFRGTHLGLPSVKSVRAATMTLQFSEPPMMEVDGELRQARSSTVKIECLPRALNVIAAPGYPR